MVDRFSRGSRIGQDFFWDQQVGRQAGLFSARNLRREVVPDQSFPLAFRHAVSREQIQRKQYRWILADATDRLLRATKKRMLRENGRIDYKKLGREGLNAAVIQRLKAL